MIFLPKSIFKKIFFEKTVELTHIIKEKMSYKSESKYFSYLSGLTVKELREIARKSGIYGYTALRKTDLVRFLDRRSRVIKKCVEKRIFPFG